MGWLGDAIATLKYFNNRPNVKIRINSYACYFRPRTKEDETIQLGNGFRVPNWVLEFEIAVTLVNIGNKDTLIDNVELSWAHPRTYKLHPSWYYLINGFHNLRDNLLSPKGLTLKQDSKQILRLRGHMQLVLTESLYSGWEANDSSDALRGFYADRTPKNIMLDIIVRDLKGKTFKERIDFTGWAIPYRTFE